MYPSKIIIGAISFILFSKDIYAVPPPDFIIQATSQLVSFFTVGVALLSGIYAIGIQFLRAYYLQHRKIALFVGIPGVFFLAGVGAYYVNDYYQGRTNAEYTHSWVEQSLENRQEYPSGIFFETGGSQVISGKSMDIKILSGTIQEAIGATSTGVDTSETDFFISNKNTNLIISDQEFAKLIQDEKGSYILLDAREDMEYDIGHIPGSIHIRFADLKDGKWSQLARDKYVVVACWSGIRGKEVAEYLRDRGIVSLYLRNGVNGWVDDGGLWEGEIKFSKVYGKTNYSKLITTQELRSISGVTLIDARPYEIYMRKGLPGSINISMLATPERTMEKTFSVVASGSKVILICDDYVNCFDAKLTGIELEKRGAIFLGRYNTPWQY